MSTSATEVGHNEWHKGEMWQLVVNETIIHSIHYWIRITKLHNDWNGMDICLTNNHLPKFSFISLIWSESETNVELHPKLKMTIILKFKEHYSFTTILLNINSIYLFAYLLRKLQISVQGVCFVVDCWQYWTYFPFPVKGTLSAVTRVAMVKGGNEMRSRRF